MQYLLFQDSHLLTAERKQLVQEYIAYKRMFLLSHNLNTDFKQVILKEIDNAIDVMCAVFFLSFFLFSFSFFFIFQWSNV